MALSPIFTLICMESEGKMERRACSDAGGNHFGTAMSLFQQRVAKGELQYCCVVVENLPNKVLESPNHDRFVIPQMQPLILAEWRKLPSEKDGQAIYNSMVEEWHKQLKEGPLDWQRVCLGETP